MKTTILASALALAALSGAATPGRAAGEAPAEVKAGSYAIEPVHTRVTFSVSHFGFTKYQGEFRDAAGTLNLDPANPDASSVDVKVATGTVTVPTEKLRAELVGPEWLDAAKFPEIAFKSTKVVRTGPDTADVTGDFTLHGVTKPLTLKVVFNAAGPNPVNKHYTAGFAATGTIRRTDFGVKTYAPMIGDEVAIAIEAPFEKK